MNVEPLLESTQKVQTTAQLNHAPFLNGENVTIEGQKIEGVPMVVISDPNIKNEKVSIVNLDVYAGFGINHLTAENSPLSSLAEAIKNGTVIILGGPRGGNEYGERWGEISLNREESYQDVLAQLTWISQNYPNARISLTGDSNGGLTVMGSFLYGILNNQNGQYDKALEKLSKIAIRNSVTDLSALLYTFEPPVSLAWQVAEDGNPSDRKQWPEIEKSSPMHMLQKIIQMKDGPEKQKILAELRKVLILVTTNMQDRTVDPSQTTRLLAALGLVTPNSFGYLGKGDHSGALTVQKEESNLESALYWTTITAR